MTGFLRDMAMAASFGSAPEIGAFMVAYRLANLFRRVLGEGNLQAGFVPHFVTQKEDGPLFYRDVTFSFAILLFGVVLFLEGALWGCIHLVPASWLEIIELSMLMVPGLFFICLYGLNAALLQCQKKYFLPAVAPVAFNLIWIAVVLFSPNVKNLSIAITVAFAGQWLMTAFTGAKLLPFKLWLKPEIFSSHFKTLLKPMALGIVGVSATQLNSALDAIFARVADSGGPAFLWYSIRIQQLPLALFGMALSGALLPPLSREQDSVRRKELLLSALKISGNVMLPCTFGIFALAIPGVNLLYGHGGFSSHDVYETSRCLWAYGGGLVPAVFVMLLAAYFYAQKKYKLPTKASLIAVGINMALNAFFVFVLGWGAISIAIATSISAIVNMAILSRKLLDGSFIQFMLKVAIGCAIPAAIVGGFQKIWMVDLPRDVFAQLLQFGICASVYLLGVLGMFWRLGLMEFLTLLKGKKAAG